MPLRALLPRLVACPLLARRPAARPAVTTEAAAPGSGLGRGMPVTEVSELPAEARRTLRLIDEGGPFPHERDGSVFGAFGGLLPRHENGSYRECTVPAPDDRGARRVVTGRNGGTYRTDAPHASSAAVPR
ncbi:ribonuclease domain-containing protein [Streptomyces sp. I4(2020)]|uniref:ribonuclease domain-containing protein n=1 Tax=Streptomyces sp. I4(2020) TaxID=2760981 RepID=UPI0018EE67AE|nr:ribonuclease domain-containing protein [Streptomyces sp. I4(2020)]MBJ6627717.1 ribonuclease N [Streptomyces sp. I4(2020)]